MTTQIRYGRAHAEMDRIEAECGCELPAFDSPANVTLADRARRALNCADPPAGDDRDFCRRVLGGSVVAG